MKIQTILPAVLFRPCALHGATINAFWSVQNAVDSNNSPNGNVTSENFPGTPSISRVGGVTTNVGGAASFTDYTGATWLGSDGSANPGSSFGWSSGSGNSITISLDMTNVYDLTMRADIRSAEANGASRPTSFSAIEYSVGGGAFTSTGSSLAFGIPASNNFEVYTLDFSALSAIENQGNVMIRFTIPDLLASTSLRLDNIQLQADLVPEPSGALLSLLGVGLLALRRKR